jgi:hypothetical protein
MCEMHIRIKLHRAACTLSDPHSYFLPNQDNSCSRILNNKCTFPQEYIGKNVRTGKEYLAGTLREFVLNQISNSVCTLACNLLPPRCLNMKFGTRRSEEKLYMLGNDCEVSVGLQPMKLVFVQPIYRNCASLCSVCELKEYAKKINISLLFVFYRN